MFNNCFVVVKFFVEKIVVCENVIDDVLISVVEFIFVMLLVCCQVNLLLIVG